MRRSNTRIGGQEGVENRPSRVSGQVAEDKEAVAGGVEREIRLLAELVAMRVASPQNYELFLCELEKCRVAELGRLQEGKTRVEEQDK